MARTGVTGGELAEKLGMTQRSMSRRLTGDATFRDAELVEIAAVLGVPVTQLLPATEPAGDAR
jgi:transcriptional regulator with XRE-family HTH domain